jgi:hypothetical protein
MTRRWFGPLSLMFLVAPGCTTTTIVPPRMPVDPVSVYVTDYGRHSSILLPDPRGHLTEFAYGDWDWFVLRHTDSGSGLHALFASKYSTLGRRQLNVDDRDEVDAIAAATKAAHVAKIDANRDRVTALLQRLDQFYDRHLDTVTFSPSSQLWFVRYHGRYGLFHNCNHVTAGWLRELGCDVRGSAMFSKFTVRAPQPAASTTTSTASVGSREKLGNALTYGRAGG